MHYGIIYSVTEVGKRVLFPTLVDSRLSKADLAVLPHGEGFFTSHLLDRESSGFVSLVSPRT